MTRRTSYYGLIGNGSTAALIAPDLAVAWLSIPRFDAAPVFASALDPRRGGAWHLYLLDSAGRRTQAVPRGQSYLGNSNVLSTSVIFGDLEVTSHDFMPWQGRTLVREISVTNMGGADWRGGLEVQLMPVVSRHIPVRLEADVGSLQLYVPGGVLHLSGQPGLEVTAPGAAVVPLGPIAPRDSFQVRLVAGIGRDAVEAATSDTRTAAEEVRFWETWLAGGIPAVSVPGDDWPDVWQKAYYRSLLTLKLLCSPATGAMIAAPTASFPAVPGGSENWDYRYVWLRDGAYAAMALVDAGFRTEAAAYYSFVFSLQGPDGHWQQPLYTIDGGHPIEIIVDDLNGPDGERPVRLGNAASGQLQLDNEGNILYGVWHYYQRTGDMGFLRTYWDPIRRAADWTASHWMQPESGIWEIREYVGHWVHGKALCHACLTAAAEIARVLGHDRERSCWQMEARRIRKQVLAQGWSPSKQAFLRDYRPDAPLDISVLALGFYGLIDPHDPRLASTVNLMERSAEQGGLMHCGGVSRYADAVLPFYLPTFWLARHYLLVGRQDDADRLIETCLASATDLYLMAEHFDPRTGRQWGNFPQSFSHEELVRTLIMREQLNKSQREFTGSYREWGTRNRKART